MGLFLVQTCDDSMDFCIFRRPVCPDVIFGVKMHGDRLNSVGECNSMVAVGT